MPATQKLGLLELSVSPLAPEVISHDAPLVDDEILHTILPEVQLPPCTLLPESPVLVKVMD